MRSWSEQVVEALRLLVERCPRLAASCYWAGTSAIAVEELGHRESLDLDLHTRRALQDVRPLLGEINAAFPRAFSLLQPPDEHGSGFSGVLTLPAGERVAIEVLANFEDVPDRDLVTSSSVAGICRISLRRYLADKVQCLAERAEARDLVDVQAVLRAAPRMQQAVRRILRAQDPLLLVARLLSWSDAEIAEDLKAYPGVNPGDACRARDLLLAWLRAEHGAEHGPEGRR